MADRNGQYFPLTAGAGERGFRVLHPYLDRFADIFQAYIPHQCSREQARLAQNLEAVANTEHQAAGGGEIPHRLHHWREFRDRPGAEVIAVGESAGHDDGFTILQVVGFVPQQGDRLSGHLLDCPTGIMVTVGSWENDDAEFHLVFLGENFT